MSEEKNKNERLPKIKFANGTKLHNGSSDPMYNLKRNQSPLLENTLPAKFIKSAANLTRARNKGKEMETAAKYGNDLTRLFEDITNEEDDFKIRSSRFYKQYGERYDTYHKLLLNHIKNIEDEEQALLYNIYEKELPKFRELTQTFKNSPNTLTKLDSEFKQYFDNLKMSTQRRLHMRIKEIRERFFEDIQKKLNRTAGGKSTKRTRKHKSKRLQSRRK